MWAIRVESYGNYGCIVPLGNSGAQKLRNKTAVGGYPRLKHCVKWEVLFTS